MLQADEWEDRLERAEQQLGGEVPDRDPLLAMLRNEAPIEGAQIIAYREITDGEERMGLLPSTAAAYAELGLSPRLIVEEGIGRSHIDDSIYRTAGIETMSQAELDALPTHESQWVLGIKEPHPPQFAGRNVFTFIHPAGDPALTKALLLGKGTALRTAIAYETVEDENGALPILWGPSVAAGWLAAMRLATAELFRRERRAERRDEPSAAQWDQLFRDGREELDWLYATHLGSFPDTPTGLDGIFEQQRMTVLGSGIVGRNAALTLAQLNAHVIVTDVDEAAFSPLMIEAQRQETNHHIVKMVRRQPLVQLESSPHDAAILAAVMSSQGMVGAISTRGGKAPTEVSEPLWNELLSNGRLFGVSNPAIDQGEGGNFAMTEIPGLHNKDSDGWVTERGVMRHNTTNMPSRLPIPVSRWIAQKRFPYELALALFGMDKAMRYFPGLSKGIVIHGGYLRHQAVARDTNLQRHFKALP